MKLVFIFIKKLPLAIFRNSYLLALLFSSSLARPVLAADEPPPPRLSAEFLFELQYDNRFHSENNDHEQRDLYTTVESGISLRLLDPLALYADLIFEPIAGLDDGRNRYFDDQGLFAEQLFLAYQTEAGLVKAGKLNPAFGILNWRDEPGMYGALFADDYEITEQIGLELELPIRFSQEGELRWTAAAFFADTTFLSESIINHRYYDDAHEKDRNDKSLGGVGNNEKLDSFSTTLTGTGFASLPGLFWNVGFSHFEGDDDLEDQRSGVAGATYLFEIPEGPLVELLAEGVFQDNADGIKGDERTYLTSSAAFAWNNWMAIVSGSQRRLDPDQGSTIDDRLLQLSAGYQFSNGLGAEVAYLRTNEDREHTSTLGFLFSYVVIF